MEQASSLKRKADDTDQKSDSKKPRVDKSKPTKSSMSILSALLGTIRLTEGDLTALQHPEFTEGIKLCSESQLPSMSIVMARTAFTILFKAYPTLQKKFKVDYKELDNTKGYDIQKYLPFVDLLKKAVDSGSEADWLSVFQWPGWRQRSFKRRMMSRMILQGLLSWISNICLLIVASDGAIVNAWTIAYSGESHNRLFEGLCQMREDPIKDKTNIVTVHQSSGYGKSRMLLEHSSIVFTFPFNLRHPNETVYGML